MKKSVVKILNALFKSTFFLAAFAMALSHPVSIPTGGPGTWKTTCLKALITTLEVRRIEYALASPTGRAAKRLSEATGRTATTIHHLLECFPMTGFKHGSENPLPIDFLIVDEASMLNLAADQSFAQDAATGHSSFICGRY